MKNLLAVIMILIMPLMVFGKEFISIEEESKMKEYNPNAQWRKVACENCSGTGSVTKYIRDVKTNRSIAIQVMCPYCKGAGSRGMSKY
jgi:DnaJ-class molecular chaperone